MEWKAIMQTLGHSKLFHSEETEDHCLGQRIQMCGS